MGRPCPVSIGRDENNEPIYDMEMEEYSDDDEEPKWPSFPQLAPKVKRALARHDSTMNILQRHI